jgi:hypothetical protein
MFSVITNTSSVPTVARPALNATKPHLVVAMATLQGNTSLENLSLYTADGRRYTRALEERVAYLEGKLSRFESRAADDPVTTANASSVVHPIAPFSQPQSQANATSGLADIGSNALGEIIRFLSLGSLETPAYVGSSSGLSLAANLGEMVQATVLSKALPMLADSTGSRERASSCDRKRLRLDELLANRADPPNDEMGSRILNAYLNRLHTRYPFLDRAELWHLHEDRWRLARTKPEDLSKAERFGIFKLYLVYAIAATMIQLSEKYTYIAPEVCLPEPFLFVLY